MKKNKELNLGRLLGSDRYIGADHEPYVIAEIGGNHDGNIQKALLLIEQTALAGADCTKFQIFKTEELFDSKSKAYPAVRGYKTQFDRMKSIELAQKDFRILANRCKELGIHFSASPWNREAIDFLIDDLKVPFIKIGSGDINNIPLLKHLAKKKVPVFLSTGGASLKHIQEALRILGRERTVIMHCTLPYPTKHENVNLYRMKRIEEEFGTLVGYSDHTTSNDACIGAGYMGACVVEKHFASNNGYKCTGDHKVSAEFEDLKQLVKLVKRAYLQKGDFNACFDGLTTEEEQLFGSNARRAILARKNIKKGERLSEKNLFCMRPEKNGVSTSEWDRVVSSTAKKDIKKGEYLEKGYF